MINLATYIFESDNSERYIQNVKVWDPLIKMFEGSKLSKDNISSMLSKLDMKTLKILSDYLADYNNTHYIAFQPNNDEFIKDTNKASVVDKMSEFFVKYITNI